MQLNLLFSMDKFASYTNCPILLRMPGSVSFTFHVDTGLPPRSTLFHSIVTNKRKNCCRMVSPDHRWQIHVWPMTGINIYDICGHSICQMTSSQRLPNAAAHITMFWNHRLAVVQRTSTDLESKKKKKHTHTSESTNSENRLLCATRSLRDCAQYSASNRNN